LNQEVELSIATTAVSVMATIRRRESVSEEKPKILDTVKTNPSASCEAAVAVEEKPVPIVTAKVRDIDIE
jgi:hypothetical protein